MSLTHHNGPHPPSRLNLRRLRLQPAAGGRWLHAVARGGRMWTERLCGAARGWKIPKLSSGIYIYIYKHMWLYIPNMVENGNHTQVMVGKSVENHG